MFFCKLMLLSLDQLLYVSSLFITLVSSFAFNYIDNTNIKHLYSIGVSTSIILLVFGAHTFAPILIPALFVWVVGFYIYNSPHLKRKLVWICLGVWVTLFLHLSLTHLIGMSESWLQVKTDTRTVQMLLVIKLTGFITDITYYSYYNTDGVDMFDRSYIEYPDLLEWLGFIFFIPSFLVGPTLTIAEYRNFINLQKHDSSSNTKRLEILGFKTSILLVLSLIGTGLFDPFYIVTNSFASHSFLYKCLFLVIGLFLLRCKYYFVWSLSEMCYVASGASQFVNHSGKNFDFFKIELPSNTYNVLNSWNVCTNNWLKQYVYRPLTDMNINSYIPVFGTNFVSALWHGFYPGYYITFILGGVANLLGRSWRNNISKKINISCKPSTVQFYDMCKIPIMILLMDFISLPFQIYSWGYSISAYSQFKWYGIIMLILGTIGTFTFNEKLLGSPK